MKYNIPIEVIPRTSASRHHYAVAEFAGIVLPPLSEEISIETYYEIYLPWIEAEGQWSMSMRPGRPKVEIHVAFLDDLEMKITSWQARVRDGNPTYLSIVTGFEYVDQILARQGGRLKIYKGHRYVDEAGGRMLAEIIDAEMDSVRYDRGGRRASVTIVGYVTQTHTNPKTVTLDKVAYQSLQADGKRRLRAGVQVQDMETEISPEDWDFVIRPGDTVVYEGESMEVGFVSIAVSPTQEIMEMIEK